MFAALTTGETILIVAAFICFLLATIMRVIARAWDGALVAAGLACFVLMQLLLLT